MNTRQNRFAAALRDLMDQPGQSLTAIAEAAGIQLSELSRYRSGKAIVSRKSIASIAAALPPEDGVPLVVAYLRDEIPQAYEQYIQVLATLSIISEPTEQTLTRWQRALKWVSAQETNPSIAEWLIGTSELIQGLPPTASPSPSPSDE